MSFDYFKKTKNVSIAMNETLYQRLRESAEKDCRTISSQCRIFITAALDIKEKLTSKKNTSFPK